MSNEITGTALLHSDLGRIDEEVDRIAMAYCEAQLIAWARTPGEYKAKSEAMRRTLLQETHAPLLHLLYWFDVRADYWSRHDPPPRQGGGDQADADEVTDLLRNFANDAAHLQRLAKRAKLHAAGVGKPNDQRPSKAESVLTAFVTLLGTHNPQ